MKAFDWENRFAILATGIVLFGVLAAASSAFAGGKPRDGAANRTTVATQAETHRAMAEEAIRAVKSEVRLDLDIQLKRAEIRIARR